MLKIGKVLFIALSISIFSSPLSAMTPKDMTSEFWNERSTGQQVFIVGGVITVIVTGITFLYRWITREESNEKMYIRINSFYNDIFEKYNDTRLHKDLVNNRTESALINLMPHASIFENKLADISADIRRLKEVKNSLQARIVRDTQNNGPMLSEMNMLLANIRNLIEALEPLNEFWQEHKTFFRAYKKSAEIGLRWQKTIEHSNDQEFIKRSIMSSASLNRADYPYLAFVNMLKNDMSILNQYTQKTKQYPLLYERIGQLLCEINELLATIVTMPEYTNDLHLKKQHELEQERIAIERQKAEAERAKAQAMAAQAAAEHAKVQAMYQQAAAEREKAQAIKEQTLVQLAQPKPQAQHININVQAPAQPVSSVPSSQTVHHSKPVNKPSKPSVAKPSVAPAPVVTVPPSYDVTKLFEAIENLTPSAVSRLDFHIPQLEARYGGADKAIINNHSLISAAIEAKNLTAFDKAELIAWLKNYGIRPTSADEQKARQTGEQIIIKAVLE